MNAPSILVVEDERIVALNIADECFRARQSDPVGASIFNEKALQLERLVDQVLEPTTAAPRPPAP